MRFYLRSMLFLAALLAFCGQSVMAADEPLPTFTDAKEAGPDYEYQGEYAGEVKTDDGPLKLGVQVIALGDGKFQAVAYHGGLPGEGWKKENDKHSVEGQLKEGAVRFQGDEGSGVIKGGVLSAMDSGGKVVAELKKIERKSSTLGAKPPAGAVVLFDGTSADAFEEGKMTEDKLLEAGTKSKESFGSCVLHLEFRTPFMPTARGQARGNSGMYLQDRYEVQILDSFGLEGKDNECGGIYSIVEPKLNMCFPPLSWQTYDVDFTAPKFDAGGKKVANARLTLKHNGVAVYDNYELPKLTPGGADAEAPKGPLQLQQHGNPVHYRNIWLVEKR